MYFYTWAVEFLWQAEPIKYYGRQYFSKKRQNNNFMSEQATLV